MRWVRIFPITNVIRNADGTDVPVEEVVDLNHDAIVSCAPATHAGLGVTGTAIRMSNGDAHFIMESHAQFSKSIDEDYE